MSDLEKVLRDGLHDRLDSVELRAGALSAVPARAARIRRRRTAVLAGVTSVTLLAGISAATYLPRDDRDASGFSVTQDGGAPERSDLSARAERYAERMGAGDFDSVRTDMSEKARAVLSESVLRRVWHSVYGEEGLGEIEAGPVLKTGDRDVVAVHVPGEVVPGGTLYVIYNAAREVSGLLLVEPTAFGETQEPAVLRAHEVARQLEAGAFAEIRRDFDPTMLGGLSEERLRASWQQVVDLYGPAGAPRGHIAVDSPTGHRVVDVVVHFRDGVMKVRVAFDAEQRIAGLFILVLDA